MTDLRAALTALGHHDVRTYLASGNAMFTATGTDTTTRNWRTVTALADLATR